jgi:hypothetical protein
MDVAIVSDAARERGFGLLIVEISAIQRPYSGESIDIVIDDPVDHHQYVQDRAV